MPRFSAQAQAFARLSSRPVGLHAKKDPDAGRDSEFAATVVSLPPSLDGSWPVPAPALEAVSEPPPNDDLAAAPTLDHIGRYALKRQLGAGGLGCVHEAWDPLLSRTVAVKTLQFNVGASERLALDRLFLAEARAVAGLSHSHIVTVYDAGLSAHGVYIAMERLRGRDLRQALAAGWRPTPAQAAQLVRRVADALAYAHGRGVVHCDIKPGNIFLTRKDRPTVLDFGIARVVHGAQGTPGSSWPSPLEGLVAGSPHYQAPEQLQGGTIDGRTDVYALGVVLYELLAGRKAFAGDSLEQITNAVLHHNPPPADALQPQVPPALAAVAAKAMARQPADRYDSAAAFSQALRPWQAAPTDAAAPAASAGTTGMAGGSRRGLLLRLSGFALAAGALGAAGSTWWRSGKHGEAATPAPSAGPAPASSDVARAAADTSPGAGTGAGSSEVAPPASAADTPAGAVAQLAEAPAAPPASAPAAKKPRPRKPVAAPQAPPTAPATGTLRLAISPWGEVEVDGRPAGVTPPLTRLDLSAGSHRITVRNGDFPPFSTEVMVDPDQATTLRHRFGS